MRLLKTANFWAEQGLGNDKELRAALDGCQPDGYRGKTQPLWYLSTVLERLPKASSADDLGLDEARARLATAQAERHEMENAARRGELAEVADVERTWIDMVMAVRSRLLSLPTKLAPQLVGISDPREIFAKLTEEIRVALTELAGGNG